MPHHAAHAAPQHDPRPGDASPSPALLLRGVQFRYAPHAPLTLDVPEFTLARAEQAALTGGSGSGKSTLLNLVAGLMEPTAGEVRVDGRRVHALRGAARDRFRGERIGMIFQTHHLLPGFTAIENVMLALTFSAVPPAEHRGRAADLLTRLGIDRHAADVQTLSVGQQQRVAVARALVARPALVLADEPTASLDPANAAAAIDLLERACQDAGAALLVVTHDPAAAERFARRVPLADLNRAASTSAATPAHSA